MSFFASNNRILVTDGTATVFDTNDDMPHILGQATFTQEIVFPTPTSYTTTTGLEPTETPYQSYECTYSFEQVCRQEYGCDTTYGQVCSSQFVCNYDFSTGQNNCGFQEVCNFGPIQTCGIRTVCNYENVQRCAFVTRIEYGSIQHYGTAYNSLEWASSVILASLPSLIECNFLLSKVTAVKNYSNEISIMTKVSSLGTDTFAFQGSALVEIAGQGGGANTSMARIISIYPDNVNKKLILEARHSNAAMSPGTPPVDVYNGGIQSSYTLTITVYYGRFR